jgi:uncharacterized membrane protein YqhA
VSTAPNMAAPIIIRVPRAYRWLQIASVIALIVALLVLIYAEMQRGGARAHDQSSLSTRPGVQNPRWV